MELIFYKNTKHFGILSGNPAEKSHLPFLFRKSTPFNDPVKAIWAERICFVKKKNIQKRQFLFLLINPDKS
jgi:hypothetical protein